MGHKVELNAVDKSHFLSDGFLVSEADGKASPKSGNSFYNLLFESLQKVNDYQIHADKLSKQIVSQPESVSVHDLMIALQKGQMAIDLTRNVVNKATTAYQSIINMR